jgi:hypothetical protein
VTRASWDAYIPLLVEGKTMTDHPAKVSFSQEPVIIFADGVLSQTFAPGISKLWLYRVDVDPHASTESASTPVAQIIMPAEQFVNMVAFLETRVDLMVRRGIVREGLLEDMRNGYAVPK